MKTVYDIYNCINEIAPFNTAMNFDNVGLLVGDEDQVVSKVLVCLDVTREVVKEAHEIGAELIISHHPVIFESLKNLSSDSIPCLLAKSEISCICAHTNLDMADGGVNTCLAKKINLKNIRPLDQVETKAGLCNMGLVGDLEKEMTATEFAGFVKESLDCNGVRYINIDKKIKKVAVCSGSGGDLVMKAYELNADAFVTGEIKHHELLIAADRDLVVVDAGHFKTEDIFCLPFIEKLASQFETLEFVKSKKSVDQVEYI